MADIGTVLGNVRVGLTVMICVHLLTELNRWSAREIEEAHRKLIFSYLVGLDDILVHIRRRRQTWFDTSYCRAMPTSVIAHSVVFYMRSSNDVISTFSMFHRERPEKEYAYANYCSLCNYLCFSITAISPLYRKYNIGTTIWSPLASGLLSGKVLLAFSPSLPSH
jgi:hypothetical protein